MLGCSKPLSCSWENRQKRMRRGADSLPAPKYPLLGCLPPASPAAGMPQAAGTSQAAGQAAPGHAGGAEEGAWLGLAKPVLICLATSWGWNTASLDQALRVFNLARNALGRKAPTCPGGEGQSGGTWQGGSGESSRPSSLAGHAASPGRRKPSKTPIASTASQLLGNPARKDTS